MKQLTLALAIITLAIMPANAGILHKTAKVIMCPVYIFTGFTVGHLTGGFLGALVGERLWEMRWAEQPKPVQVPAQ